MWGILGFVASASGPLIHASKWLYKKWHKKTEPQRVELPNRDVLVRAIGEVASTASTLLIRTRELNWMMKETPFQINTELTQTHQDANTAYVAAIAKLEQERLVAGYVFREPISDFVVFVMEQFDTRAELRPQDISGLADITLKAEETVKRIDAIVSGQENP